MVLQAGWSPTSDVCGVLTVLQVNHDLGLQLLSCWFLLVQMLQDKALQIRKWMKSLIRALNGILKTFICTWGSMYAEIKQQPLLACFLCSYNLSSRLYSLTVIFSLYIYVFIYLYSETPCILMEFCGVIVAVFSPAMPWIILGHQGVKGIWACCLCCSSSILVSVAVVWGFSRSLLIYLWVLWPVLDMSEGHGKSWWGSSAVFSWCPALPLPRSPSTLPDGPAAVSGSHLPSKQVFPIS